jgi:hypothetical protein
LEAEIEEMEGYILGPENEPLIPDGEVLIQRRYNKDKPYTAELQPEKLNLYSGKNIREYREWIRSVENVFRLVLRKFR